jgi:peptidoglycan/LPS O-acetylase OafA/YrhL
MESFTILAGAAAVMLAVIGTAAIIARFIPFYRHELADNGQRELALDGLRGIAALLVAVSHAALCRAWLATGDWGRTESPLSQLCAPTGVILFFMLTGYLFWGKSRAAGGKINAWKLWRGRLYRIAPLYWFSLLIVLLVAAVHTGGSWLSLENWKPLARLVALGALRWHMVGAVNPDDYNAGVVWTLWYEWAFYLTLPFIAWLAPGRKIFAVAAICYLLTGAGLWYHLNLQPGLFFILGMMCPVLLEGQRQRLLGPGTAALAIAAAIGLGLLDHNCLFTQTPAISLAAAIFPLFLLAAAGNTFFGFLTHPALRCLGAISFSFYLLHGIVFRFAFRLLKEKGIIDLSAPAYWLIITIVAIGTTVLCAMTYRWIEFPFLSASHKRPGDAAAPPPGGPKSSFIPARNGGS